jgi:hypothetical protein
VPCVDLALLVSGGASLWFARKGKVTSVAGRTHGQAQTVNESLEQGPQAT